MELVVVYYISRDDATLQKYLVWIRTTWVSGTSWWDRKTTFHPGKNCMRPEAAMGQGKSARRTGRNWEAGHIKSVETFLLATCSCWPAVIQRAHRLHISGIFFYSLLQARSFIDIELFFKVVFSKFLAYTVVVKSRYLHSLYKQKWRNHDAYEVKCQSSLSMTS
jgi:hypothetical protein